MTSPHVVSVADIVAAGPPVPLANPLGVVHRFVTHLRVGAELGWPTRGDDGNVIRWSLGVPDTRDSRKSILSAVVGSPGLLWGVPGAIGHLGQ